MCRRFAIRADKLFELFEIFDFQQSTTYALKPSGIVNSFKSSTNIIWYRAKTMRDLFQNYAAPPHSHQFFSKTGVFEHKTSNELIKYFRSQ